MKKLLLLISLLSTLFCSGCKKNESESAVELIFNKTESSLQVGGTPLQLAVTAPENYVGNSNMVWMSANNGIATVSATGLVTAVGPGITIITGYVKGQNAVRGEYKITVTGKIDTSLKTEFTSYNVVAGDTLSVKYSYSPKLENSWQFAVQGSDTVGMKYVSVLTEIDNPKKFGQLDFKGLQPGVVEVTLVNKVDTTVKTSFAITIKDVAMQSFNLDKATYNVELGLNDTVKAEILPKTAAYRTLNFKSSNTNIFTIDALGAISPISIGEAYVYVTTQDGRQVSSKVTVTPATTKKILFEKNVATYSIGINDRAGVVNVATQPKGGATITVVVDDTYVPKLGLRSNIFVAKTNLAGTQWSVAAPFGITGYGTARLIASNGTVDADGKLIADTCIVTVKGMDNKLLLIKSQYYGVELGAKTVITASASRFEFKQGTQVTLQEALLFVPKDSTIYNAATKENEKLKDDMIIETLTPNQIISAPGTETFTFATIKSAPHLKWCQVKYTFKTSNGGADTFYIMNQQVVSGNNAPYVAPIQ